MSTQKGSPYTELVNAKLYALHEQGLLSTWIEEMVANSSSCDTIRKVVASHGSPTAVLSLDELRSFFFIVVCGLSVSFFAFLAERATVFLNRQSETRN